MNPKLDSFTGNGNSLAPELFQGQRKKQKTKNRNKTGNPSVGQSLKSFV